MCPVIAASTTIRRFFHDNLSSGPGRIDLPPDEAKHARRVLRVEAGDRVELFDGAGQIADGVVESVGKGVTIRIERLRMAERSLPTIDVAAAMPKGDRASVMVEKLSELGVDRLTPLTSERSVVDPGKGKRDRFDRIALESAKQCGRPWVMTIDPPTPVGRVIPASTHGLRLIADPEGVQKLPIPDGAAGVQNVLVLVGPEGGWTPDEVEAAKNAGFTAWRYAPHILRVETAAIAAAAILRDRLAGAVE